MELKRLDKKSLFCLGLITIMALAVIVLVFYSLKFLLPKEKAGIEEEIVRRLRRIKIVKQLEELEGKKEEEIPPLPRKEILRQLQELNKSR